MSGVTLYLRPFPRIGAGVGESLVPRYFEGHRNFLVLDYSSSLRMQIRRKSQDRDNLRSRCISGAAPLFPAGNSH